MGKVSYIIPVKLLIGMLSQDIAVLEHAAAELQKYFGPRDLISPVWQWNHTRYYEKEMGKDLKRQFIFFAKLFNPGEIADIKLRTNELEQQFCNDLGGRSVNLDPGYLDAAKLVLASTKDFSHRIYIGKGIYGEVTLSYTGGHYTPLPHTFPDYRTEEYRGLFDKARELYRQQLKNEKTRDSN
jgi:hypothetical protein